MIPNRIIDYLEEHGVPYERHVHRRAFTAQELAAAMHVTGRRVAKTVVVGIADRVWLAVLPASESIDVARLESVLRARFVRILPEAEFARLFPECERGAEPPFGRLYGLPVVVDADLAEAERIVFAAGTHEEAIEMRYEDFADLEERPLVGRFGYVPEVSPRVWTEWPEAIP
jgi:Ala-tRNA(Pro) deacylase